MYNFIGSLLWFLSINTAIPAKIEDTSQRLLVGVWWLSAVLVVIPWFISETVSRLSISRSIRVDSLQDVLHHANLIKPTIMGGGLVERIFKVSYRQYTKIGTYGTTRDNIKEY